MKTYITTILILTLCLFSAPLMAQQFPWSAFFGSQGADFATDIKQTADNGYIIAAYGSTGNSANYYVVKLDEFGQLQWARNISKDNYSSRAYSVIETSNGNYVLVGVATQGRKPWLVKLNSAGETIWESAWTDNLPANSAVIARGISLPDNRIVVIGAEGQLGQQPNMFIVSPEGELLEQRSLNAPVPPGWYSGTIVTHIEPTSDGGFILTGTAGGGSGSKAFLWKFDQQADSSWVTVYNNYNMRAAESVKQLPDGGYILAGFSSPNSEHAAVKRTDAFGNVIWSQVYTDEHNNPATDIIPWHNDEFLVTEKHFYGAGSIFFQSALLRIDGQGNFMGRDMIMASDSSTAITRMRLTNDGGYIMAGEINEYLVMNQQDLFVLKSDSLGTINGIFIDYVWPGDVNYDGVVDMHDLMILGLTAGATGPERLNASLQWFPQYVTNWADTVVTGVNFKHADTDGNGMVDISDTLAIIVNYGLTHNYTSRSNAQTRQSGNDLFVIPADYQLIDGQHVQLPVFLGDASNGINHIYGLLFTAVLEGGVIPQSLKMDFADSWIGNPNQEMWAIQKSISEGPWLDVGITRNNHQTISGYGQLGILGFTLAEPLLPGQSVELNLNFEGFVAYGYELVPIELYTSAWVLNVTNSVTSVHTPLLNQQIRITPNPSNGYITVTGLEPMNTVVVYDLSGRIITTQTAAGEKLQLNIPVAGLYVLEVRRGDEVVRERLVVR
jgi:hypothetical protein